MSPWSSGRPLGCISLFAPREGKRLTDGHEGLHEHRGEQDAMHDCSPDPAVTLLARLHIHKLVQELTAQFRSTLRRGRLTT